MSTDVATARATKFWQAINQALVEEFERDERVVLVGEDVAAPGGPYGVTRGLRDKFGDARVRDTPISEATLVGLGIGSAAVGLRPIVEIMFFDFTMLAMDQIVNQAAKFRYFTAGHSLPLVIRTMCGAGGHNGAQHSQNLEAWFAAVPGLTVVMPSNAADAKGLLKSAIRSDDPVLFIETLGLLTERTEMPTHAEFLLPIGKADIKRPGDDVTVVATGRMVSRALQAAERAQTDHGISVEVVDPRTLQPLDTDTILTSVARTGRLVVTHEAPAPYGFGAEVCAVVAEHLTGQLKSRLRRVTPAFVNVPTPLPLVESRVPNVDSLVEAIRGSVEEES